MKKVSILFTIAIAILAGSSCTAKAPKADLKNDVDTLSYVGGMARTQGLSQYLEQLGVDSLHMSDFLKGLNEGAAIDKNDKKKTAYVVGLQIGQQVGTAMFDGFNQQVYGEDSTQTLNKQNYLAGFIAGTTKKDMLFPLEEAQNITMTKMQAVKAVAMEKQFGANKEAGIKFLEENKTKEGVVTLPNGLQYKIITAGKGPIPAASDVVKVNYKGTLIDGTEFDSSYARNEPAQFGVGQVIPGWTQALQLMPVGSKWELYVPQDLAYREMDRGTIKPYSTLIFEVELLDIVKQ